MCQQNRGGSRAVLEVEGDTGVRHRSSRRPSCAGVRLTQVRLEPAILKRMKTAFCPPGFADVRVLQNYRRGVCVRKMSIWPQLCEEKHDVAGGESQPGTAGAEQQQHSQMPEYRRCLGSVNSRTALPRYLPKECSSSSAIWRKEGRKACLLSFRWSSHLAPVALSVKARF